MTDVSHWLGANLKSALIYYLKNIKLSSQIKMTSKEKMTTECVSEQEMAAELSSGL